MPRARFDQLSAEVVAAFPRPIPPGEFEQLRSIRGGDHVALHRAMLDTTIAALRADGVNVWIVEGPLNPLADQLVDPNARRAFRDYATRLAESDGVFFLALADLPALGVDEFVDLTHLNPRGAKRFSRAVLARMGHAVAAVPKTTAGP